MPFQLAASTRRSFIAQLGGAVFSGPMLHGASAHQVDPDRIAILNDTHIGANHPGNSPVPTHLKETVAWLVNLERRPAIAVVNGDLALSDGQPGDYEHFSRLIAPLHEAGIPVHVTLGNHDDRDAFYKMLQKQKPGVTHVESKHVGVVSLSKANIFLLDSLKAPLITQGLLGKDQLEWLGRMLDENAGKPALVFAHHNPRKGEEEKHYTGGLEDSDALWDLLVSRPQVKAYIHGHIHHRYYSQHRGIHIIDTPATSFVANPTASTTGWTMLQLTDQGGEFTTLTHDKTHLWNRAAEKLTWRAA